MNISTLQIRAQSFLDRISAECRVIKIAINPFFATILSLTSIATILGTSLRMGKCTLCAYSIFNDKVKPIIYECLFKNLQGFKLGVKIIILI